MTDQELLIAAAKAAGIDAEFHSELGHGPEGMWLKGARSPDNSKYWNPLNDDGDALRLAVKLRLDVLQGNNRLAQATKPPAIYADCEISDDRTAATRRAIVRAAAQIGESK